MNKKIVSNAINGLCDVRVIMIILCGFLMVMGCGSSEDGPVDPVLSGGGVDTRDPGLAGKTVRVEEGDDTTDITVAKDGSWEAYQDIITEDHVETLLNDGSVTVEDKTFTIVYPSTH